MTAPKSKGPWIAGGPVKPKDVRPTPPSSRGPWIGAALVGIAAIVIIVPRALRKPDVSQPEAPTPAAYEAPPVNPGERRQRHPLDSNRDLNAEGKAWAQANGVSTEQAQDCKATYARFKKIKTGYSMGHVRTIMGGCDGELMSSSSIGSDRYNTYVWRGDGISLMQITFRDRTAVTINQFGLQ